MERKKLRKTADRSHTPVLDEVRLVNQEREGFLWDLDKKFHLQKHRKYEPSSLDSSVISSLPVWEYQGNEFKQYGWNGKEFKVVETSDFEEHIFQGKKLPWPESFKRSTKKVLKVIQDGFIPREVGEEYWRYVKWKLLQRITSSIIHVQATQSMLVAVGIGANNAIPAAAGLSWVLKDGLGRLGRLLYVAVYGATFDCHLKKVRFGTSLLFTLSMGLETLTPLAPKFFLPMAALANVGKSVGFAAYLATTPAVHRSFATNDNMADISAKGQAQAVLGDNVGLLLAMGIGTLAKVLKVQHSLPLLLYAPLSVAEMWLAEKEVRSVPLKNLNKERLELITKIWIAERRIASAMEISHQEAIIPCQDVILRQRKTTIYIGPLGKIAHNKEQLLGLMEKYKNDSFILALVGVEKKRPSVVLSLRKGAKTDDVALAMLQACHFRAAFEQSISDNKVISQSEEKLLINSREKAQADFPIFLKELCASDWSTRRVLLGPDEQRHYSFVDPKAGSMDKFK